MLIKKRTIADVKLAYWNPKNFSLMQVKEYLKKVEKWQNVIFIERSFEIIRFQGKATNGQGQWWDSSVPFWGHCADDI
jgi:hypothetical protein